MSPELGKATYVIELESRGFSRSLKDVKKEVDATTAATSKDFDKQTKATQDLDKETESLGKTFTKATGTQRDMGRSSTRLSTTLTRTSGTIRKTSKDTDTFRSRLAAAHHATELLGHAMGLLKWPAMLAAGGAAVKGLNALAAGAGSLTGALGSATGGIVAMGAAAGTAAGSVASLANVYGAFGQAMLAVKLSGATQAFAALSTNATTAQNAIKNTTGEAHQFAQSLFDMRDRFQNLRDAAGKGLFPGLLAGLKAATKNTGALEDVMKATGGSIGYVAKGFGQLIGSAGFAQQFRKFGLENAKVLRGLGDAGIHLFSALVKVVNVAKPLTNWWVRMVGQWAKGVDQLAGTNKETDKLNQFFTRTRKITSVLMDSLGHLIGFLKQVGHLAFGTGLSLWQQFDKWTGKVDAWAHSEGGRNTIKTYFEDAKKALDALMKVVSPMVDALVHIASLGRSSGMSILGALGKAADHFDRWVHSASGENKIRDYFKKMLPTLAQAGKLVRAIVDAFFSMGKRGAVPLAQLLKQVRTQLLPILVNVLNSTARKLGPGLITLIVNAGKILGALAGTNGPLVTLLKAINLGLGAINALLSNKLINNIAIWSIEFYGVLKLVKGISAYMTVIAAKSAVAATNLKTTEGIGIVGAGKQAATEARAGRAAAAGGGLSGALGTAFGKRPAPLAAATPAFRAGAMFQGAGEGASAFATSLGGVGAAAAVVTAALAAMVGLVLAIKDNFLGARDALVSFGKFAASGFTDLINTVSGGHADSVFNAVGSALHYMGVGMKFLAQHLGPVIKGIGLFVGIVVGTPIALVVGGIVLQMKALAFGIRAVVAVGRFFVKVAKGIVGIAKVVGKALGHYFVNAFGDVHDAVAQVVRFVSPAAKKIFGWLSWPYRKLWQFVSPILKKVLGAVKGGLGSVVGFLRDVGSKVLSWITWPFRQGHSHITDIFGKIITFLHNVLDKVKQPFEAIANGIVSVFHDIRQPLIDAVNWIIDNVINRIPGVQIGDIGGSGPSLVAHGPHTGGMTHGHSRPVRTASGHAVGIGRRRGGRVGYAAGGAVKKVAGVGSSVVQNALGAFGHLQAPGGVGPDLPGWLAGMWGWIKGKLMDLATSLPGKALHAGVQLAGKAASTVGHAASSVINTVNPANLFAGGGRARGAGGIDNIPAWLTHDEFVVTPGGEKILEQMLGPGVLHWLEKVQPPAGFAAGGRAGTAPPNAQWDVGANAPARKGTDNFVKAILKSYEGMRKDVGKVTEAHRKQTIKDFDETRKTSGKIMDSFHKATGTDYQATRKDAGDQTDAIRKATTNDMQAAQKNASDSSSKLRKAVSGDFDSLAGAVRDALVQIGSDLNKALSAMNVSPVNFGISGGGGGGGGGKGAQKKRAGGRIVGGSGFGDTVPALLEPGEVVLNRDAVREAGGTHAANRPNRLWPRGSQRLRAGGTASVYPIPFAVNGRTDMGVDFAGSGSVKAMGDATIVSTSNNGWPGVGGLVYRLSGGAPRGIKPSTPYIYHYEGMNPSVKVGQKVKAGQRVGSLVPPPASSEMGFWDPAQNNALAASHYSEGDVTPEGVAFSKLMNMLFHGAGIMGGGMVQKLKRVLLSGPKGAPLALGQSVSDKALHAANAYIAKKAPVAPGSTTGMLGGASGSVAHQAAAAVKATGAGPVPALALFEALWAESTMGQASKNVLQLIGQTAASWGGDPTNVEQVAGSFLTDSYGFGSGAIGIHKQNPGEPAYGVAQDVQHSGAGLSTHGASNYGAQRSAAISAMRQERLQTKGLAGYMRGGPVLSFGGGGTVPGPIGRPMPAVVHGGEHVLQPGELEGAIDGGSGLHAEVNVHGDIVSDREDPVEVLLRDDRFYDAVNDEVDAAKAW